MAQHQRFRIPLWVQDLDTVGVTESDFDCVAEMKPKSTQDCPGFSPCPFVSCPFNILVAPNDGLIRFFGPDDVLFEDLEVTCILEVMADISSVGLVPLSSIGRAMSVSREMVRQIIARALPKLREGLVELGVTEEDFESVLNVRNEQDNTGDEAVPLQLLIEPMLEDLPYK